MGDLRGSTPRPSASVPRPAAFLQRLFLLSRSRMCSFIRMCSLINPLEIFLQRLSLLSLSSSCCCVMSVPDMHVSSSSCILLLILLWRERAGAPRHVFCLDLVWRGRCRLLALSLVASTPALSTDCAWAPVLDMSATVQKNNRDTFGRRTSTVITASNDRHLYSLSV